MPPSNQVNATADPKVLAAYHLAMATGIPYPDALDTVYALANIARGLLGQRRLQRRAKPDPKEGMT